MNKLIDRTWAEDLGHEKVYEIDLKASIGFFEKDQHHVEELINGVFGNAEILYTDKFDEGDGMYLLAEVYGTHDATVGEYDDVYDAIDLACVSVKDLLRDDVHVDDVVPN